MDSSAAGHPAPGRGESDLSSSLESFGSEPAAAAASPGGKQLHNLRRQQARTKRAVESSATTNTSTSDEEWSPTGSGGRKKKAQTKKRGGARKGGGGGKAKKARRAAPVDSSADVEDFMGSDGMLVISRPHDHDVLSGRGGGINAHLGNQRFRDWVLERKESYTLGKDKGDKARVCQEVYDLIVSQDPPGRFLMREGGDKMKGRSGGPSLNSASISGGQSKWVEIPTSRAMAKISQALREGAPSIREAAKKEQKPKVSSRGRTPKRKMVSKVSSVSEVAASSGAGRGRKKKKAPTEKPPRTPKKSESDRKEDREMKPVASTNEPPARSRVFPEVKLAPVPAPIVAPEMMMGQYFGSKVAPGKSPSAAVHPQSNQISPAAIMTPDEIAAAEEHFRHGTLVGSPTGHGKEIIMPQPPISMTAPGALRTESDESREHRTDDDLQQAVEAEQQLNHLLQFDKTAAMSPSRPSGAAAAASTPSSSSKFGTPTPQLLPMSPVFSPTFGLGASTSGNHPTMSPPNFATMFDSPIRSGSTMNNTASKDALPPPPFAGAVADGGLQLNRSHSLALSNTASDHGMISSNEVRNIFDDDHDVANSVGSVSGGGVHNHQSSGNWATKGANHADAGSNSRAIISPILASQPSSEARDVAPIGTPSRSSSSKNRNSIGRSGHSTNSRSVSTDLTHEETDTSGEAALRKT